jgi:rod shape-determining protein MreC
MAVITADGIVGKVLEVYPSVAKVLLVNDQTSGVGVILGNSRLQGVLVGTANGEVALNGIMSDEEVPAGEKVLTSGGDQIFPKGLPVGVISKVGKGKDLFLSVKVKPAADLSKLEEVLVLVQKQERQATADNKVRVRAADILAQRLPSVPDKPAAEPNAAAAQEPAKTPQTTAPKAGIAAPQTAKTVNGGTSTISNPAAPVQTKKTAPSTSGAVTQKTVDGSTSTAKPQVPRAAPAITEQKPTAPVATPPNTQPPTDDNSPH